MAKQAMHSAEGCIGPLPFFSSPFSIESCTPTILTPIVGKYHFGDSGDAIGSGTLKTINIKPWKPIIFRNYVFY